MQINITETDYNEVIGENTVKSEIIGTTDLVLGNEGDERKDKIINMLPKVLAGKLQGMIPDNFEISEIALQLTVGGKPFGIGIDGHATVKFAPRK